MKIAYKLFWFIQKSLVVLHMRCLLRAALDLAIILEHEFELLGGSFIPNNPGGRTDTINLGFQRDAILIVNFLYGDPL